jgi:hypothetical protein
MLFQKAMKMVHYKYPNCLLLYAVVSYNQETLARALKRKSSTPPENEEPKGEEAKKEESQSDHHQSLVESLSRVKEDKWVDEQEQILVRNHFRVFDSEGEIKVYYYPLEQMVMVENKKAARYIMSSVFKGLCKNPFEKRTEEEDDPSHEEAQNQRGTEKKKEG